MKFVKKHSLFFLFLLGLILRLSLLFYDYSWDINNHIAWAKDLSNRGFRGFYETQSSEVYASLFPNYPPLSSFIFYLLYSLQTFIEAITWKINLAFPLFPSKLVFLIQNRTFLAALLKLPAVFADLGIAWLCYLFAKKFRSKNQVTNTLITTFVLFNPAFFYLSALWGQIDSVPIFFALVSVYLLLFTKKYFVSSLFFLLGILIKPTTLVYLPIFSIAFIKKFGLSNFLKSMILNLLIFWLSFLPFLKNLNNPWLPFSIFTQGIMASQSLPFVTNGAFNFWVLITRFAGIKDTAPFLLTVSYRLWGYLITGFLTVWIIMSSSRMRAIVPLGRSRLPGSQLSRDDILKNFFYLTFLIAFAAFLFLTKMHERYSLLPLPFLLLAALKNRRLLSWFISLSLISFLNLYHSWPVPKLGPITDFLYLSQVTYLLSLINLVAFLYSLKGFARIRHVDNRRSSASF